jgi:hypothetical protein
MSVHDYTDAEFRVTKDDMTLRDAETVTKWGKGSSPLHVGSSVTIERDADDEGMLGEGVSIHDVIHWVADNAPSVVWKALSRLAVSGTGLCFHRMDGDTPFRVFEVGLYSVRHCEGKDELLRVWIVPTKQESKRDIVAPVGIDGHVDETWLIARVRERFASMRREARDARRQADRTETAINVFAVAMERAAQSQPENAPF